MRLTELLSSLRETAEITGFSGDLEINGIAYDSRRVEPGYLFVAIPGSRQDGHDHIPQALLRGAAALVTERLPQGVPDGVCVILTKDSRRAMAVLSSVWWGRPDLKMRLVGVTGTNGKTTTSKLIKWLWESGGAKSGIIGTINNMAGGKVIPSTHTTPESFELFELLAMMGNEGCKNVVMEVSSHALKQGRVDACHFDGAVFTNLTQDHLDYHAGFGDYLESKLRLFGMILPENGKNKYCVVNIDDPLAERFAQACRVDLWTYGAGEGASLLLKDCQIAACGTVFDFCHAGKTYRAESPLVGKFNVYNTLAAMAVGLAEGLDVNGMIEAVRYSPQVPGRFQRVDEGQDFSVIVDYAHTPDGLLNVLATLRGLNPRRVIAVFGCGGDRDSGKRPLMGRIAGQYADFCVATSDNPRTEDPIAIMLQIEEGLKQASKDYALEADRREAISLAIGMAGPGDVVVIAGKGHEDYQIIGTERLRFDDAEVAGEILSARLR
ncbi:MAG: UDP-N-acetylmuramoyl-L-alanyl-D-glutamate--2,6-diaminopimelate ligase [Clostridiales bacterium]|nr:UDP-N-acetylmuramoyl-L-alanyl-D-glutamate--2,6-diaminopimelate ligase [Clostridiales bacterium]